MAKNDAPVYSRDTAYAALAPAMTPGMARVRQLMQGLCAQPPQVLLLEGGTEDERQAVARWWAAALNCPMPTERGPCCACPLCLQTGADLHHDVLVYDGRISNKDDEENPGPVRAFNKENARALKGRLGDSTHTGRRVVILSGMDTSRDAAANALLKVLEEPSATTVFVLLTPQREQLLPTLVSRSWVLTLPWPNAHRTEADLVLWEQAMADFLAQGRGWWGLTSTRGAVDQAQAQRVLLAFQKALMAAMGNTPGPSPLAARFAVLLPPQRLNVGRLLQEAQDALNAMVHPARVLDWTAVHMFLYTRP